MMPLSTFIDAPFNAIRLPNVCLISCQRSPVISASSHRWRHAPSMFFSRVPPIRDGHTSPTPSPWAFSPRPPLLDLPIGSLTREHFEKHMANRAQKSITKEGKGKLPGAATLNRCNATMRPVLEMARKRGLLAVNPLADVAKSKEDKNRAIRAMTDAEEKAFDSLARYKFMMFGYWAAIWVHLNRMGNRKRPSPFKRLVAFARTGHEFTGKKAKP